MITSSALRDSAAITQMQWSLMRAWPSNWFIPYAKGSSAGGRIPRNSPGKRISPIWSIVLDKGRLTLLEPTIRYDRLRRKVCAKDWRYLRKGRQGNEVGPYEMYWERLALMYPWRRRPNVERCAVVCSDFQDAERYQSEVEQRQSE